MQAKINIKSLLTQLHQRPIAYMPIYADMCGDMAAGVVLSQIMYWHSSMGGREFYKTDDEFRHELRMGVTEFRNAKKKVKAMSFIQIKSKGVPAKTHYKIDEESLALAISSFNVSHIPVCAKRPNCDSRNDQTITETTQKNTTEKILKKNTLSIHSDTRTSPIGGEGTSPLKAENSKVVLKDKSLRVESLTPPTPSSPFPKNFDNIMPRFIAALRKHHVTAPDELIIQLVKEGKIDLVINKFGKFPGIAGIAKKVEAIHRHGYEEQRDTARIERSHQAAAQV